MPGMLRVGNPDGSLIYTRLLRNELPHAASSGPLAAVRPAAVEELSAIRSWIAQLAPEGEACRTRRRDILARVSSRMAAFAGTRGVPLDRLRIVSLHHLDSGCARTAVDEWGRAVALLIGALAGQGRAAVTMPIDSNGAMLVFDLASLDWDGERWGALTGAGDAPVRADWLVARLLRGRFGAALAGDADGRDERATAAAMLRTVATGPERQRAAGRLVELLRLFEAPVDMIRATAELDISRDRIEHVIAVGNDATRAILTRLGQAVVPRAEFEAVWGQLAAATRSPLAGGLDALPLPASISRRDIALHAERSQYARGEILRLTVRPGMDCHLTLIGIDTKGRGTVLFPNDLAPRNLLRRGEILHFPGEGSGFRMRLSAVGREAFVAICSETEAAPDGIVHDFERQRFQELGDYARFMDRARQLALAPPGGEPSPDAALGPARHQRRRSREMPAVPLPSQVWRTGIVIEVR